MTSGNNMNEKKISNNLFNSESAAATVIAAVLLLSIIFTIFAIVRIGYVPEWKTNAEKIHMDIVQKDMVELKSSIDMIVRSMNSPDYPGQTYPVTVPFTLGGGEIPILEPSKSSGALSINTEPCHITITRNSSITGSPQILADLTLGGVTCHSNNKQYVDQDYRYENGALILRQGNKSLMKQTPSFIIYETKEGNYNVLIQTINIVGDNKTFFSNSDTSLRLKGIKFESNPTIEGEYIDSFSCTITTKYPDAWKSYLEETAKEAGLTYPEDYSLNKTNSGIYFRFTPADGKIINSLNISKSIIHTETGNKNTISIKNSTNENKDYLETKHANMIILKKNGIGGLIPSGNYIQFTSNGTNNWIKINGNKTTFNNSDIVRIVMNGDQISGNIDMNANKIVNLKFNIKMYINGKFKSEGTTTGISVNGLNYKSNLTYKLPAYLSETYLEVDEETLLDYSPESNLSIELYNIIINKDLEVNFNSGYTEFTCAADYKIK
ncbi:MAG: hypothetical protein ACPK85_03725 [Methanosarcina sp.]